MIDIDGEGSSPQLAKGGANAEVEEDALAVGEPALRSSAMKWSMPARCFLFPNDTATVGLRATACVAEDKIVPEGNASQISEIRGRSEGETRQQA